MIPVEGMEEEKLEQVQNDAEPAENLSSGGDAGVEPQTHGTASPETEMGSDADVEKNSADADTKNDREREENADAEYDAVDAEKEKDDADARYMRLMADFQNFRKRTEKEKQDVYAFANEKIMTGLLDVLDNFERALKHPSEDKAYAEGMRMIFQQLNDLLEKSGLEEIEALGEEFDPNVHNAVLMDDNPEFDSGKVTCVMQKGFRLNGKVIRPSMVKVNN